MQRIAKGDWTASDVLDAYLARAVLAQDVTNCLTEGQPHSVSYSLRAPPADQLSPQSADMSADDSGHIWPPEGLCLLRIRTCSFSTAISAHGETWVLPRPAC